MSFLSLLEIDKDYKSRLEINKIKKMSIEEFDVLKSDIYEIILDDYRIKNKIIHLYLNNEYVTDYTFAEFYIQMIFWRSYIYYKMAIKRDDFNVTPNMTISNIHNNIEVILKKFQQFFHAKNINQEELAKIATDIIEQINKFTIIFSWISPDTISLYDIIQFSKRNHKFHELINLTLDENMNIKDIEILLSNLEKQLIETIREDGKSGLYQYIQTGSVNKSQLRQMFTSVGTRMDIDKTVVPYPIRKSFLIGLQNAGEEYAEALTARNALIDKDKYVGDSGYEARKIDLNSIELTIDHDVEDCGTKHFLTLTIQDQQDLNRLNNKFLVDQSGKIIKAIDSVKDTNLIGKTIRIRSHIYCALNRRVCKTCYGANAEIMKGTRIGVFPSTKIQNPVSNKTISSKHYLETNSAHITSEGIIKFFEIESNTCYLKTEMDYSRIKIVIDSLYFETLLEQSQMADNPDDFDIIALENAYIVEQILDKKTGKFIDKQYPLDGLQNLYVFLSNELLEEKGAIKTSLTSDTVEIHLGKVDTFIPILNLNVVSEGVTYYLNKFVKTIDSNAIMAYQSPDEVVHEILNILNHLKMNCMIQHVETLMYNLVKDKHDYSKRPNFLHEKVQIQMLPVKTSIINKDAYTALSFERYENQLRNPLFFRRNSSGAFDVFFRTTKKFINA